jgi:hypothetical protein
MDMVLIAGGCQRAMIVSDIVPILLKMTMVPYPDSGSVVYAIHTGIFYAGIEVFL